MKKIVTLFIISILALNIPSCIFSLYFGEGWGEASAQVPTASGNYQWVKGFGSFNQQGITDEMVNAMKLDNKGNVIICGRVMGYTYVQGLGGKKDSLISNRWQNANNFQGFISKYDCNGNVLWYKELNDSMSNTDIYDFVVDANNNIYVFGKCNAGNRATYFDDSLFAPYTIPNTVIGPPVLFSLTENGKMRWNWIPPYVNAFSRLYITPQFQNHSGNVMCNTMVLHHDTINLLAFTSPLSSTPLTIGNSVFNRGYNIIRFDLTGQLIDAVRIDSNNAVFNGYGIDNEGNYLAAFNFEDTVVKFLDSVFYRSTASDVNPFSTIIKFNRHHVIRHIEFGDSTNASSANFSDLNNGFNLIVGAHTDSTIYGNYAGHSVSGLWGKLTGTVAVMHFNSISDFKWGISYDSSYSCNGFRSLCSDVNGDVYSRLPFNEYVKLGQLVETTPVGGYNDIVLKISSNLGQLKNKYPFLNLQNSNTYSTRTAYQNLITDKLGNIHLSGNVYINQVIVGTDTAKYYGGNNDMFVMRYGNPCSNTTTTIAAGTPSGLVAKCNGTAISLSWQKLNNGEDKYYIYRSLAATSGFVKIDSVLPTTNTYTDANVVTKTNYWYAISSHNIVGEGYLSMVDSARLCDDTLGGFVGSVSAKNQLKIYPNPASQSIVISHLSSVNTIEVTDVLGRTQMVRQANHDGSSIVGHAEERSISIDVSKLPSGLYFIKTTDTSGNVMNGKFVKE